MITKATTANITVGSHILTESAFMLTMYGYRGEVTRISGQRVYFQNFLKEETSESYCQLKKVAFVATSAEEAIDFRDNFNKGILEIMKKTDSFKAQLMKEHDQKMKALISTL